MYNSKWRYIKLDFGKNKTAKILVFSFLVAVLILTVIFTGCKTGKTSEEEPIAEETDEISEEVEDDSGKKIDEDKIAGMEITGDINILSGLDISGEVWNSRPIAVMIENSPDSRPQSGLIYADMVFEVVDEGGVTRYVAVYSSYDADITGPVRSARPYYAEIARSFDPIYAFWGTYPEGYDIIRKLDMDVLDGNSDVIAYAKSGWRDYSRIDPGEDTAHTAFMSTIKLKEEASGYGYSLEGGQSPLRFKIDAVNSDKGDISDITINFSYDSYRVDFEYNRENNNYLKFTGGTPHTNYETGKQIAVNNVIVMITDIEGPIDEWGHMAVRTTGTSDIGKAFFFMDGNVIEGTWERTSVFDPFKYKDDDGNVILFNRGSTWVALIQDTNRLTY